MDINLGIAPFCNSETDSVALGEAETETSFHLEEAGKHINFKQLQYFNLVNKKGFHVYIL